MATDSRKRIPSIRSVPESLDDKEGTLDFLRDVHRLMRAVREGALATTTVVDNGGTTPVPGPPGPVGPPGAPAPGTAPDLTPLPTPTFSGSLATAGFANIFVQWDVATYTQGHGNLQTNVYGAKYPGTGPLPTFSDAVLVGVAPQPDTIFILPTELGTQWHIWIKFQSRDGVESVSPAGGANGSQATTGKIGNADLGPLIVEAGNLASGAVTAAKLAAGAVEFTKFAAGLEPVGVVGSLPTPLGYTGPRTVVLTTDGKLYRLVSGSWTAAVPAADVTGQLTDAQIASIAAAKLTGQITGTQITDGSISTPKLAAGAVTAAQIAADTITAAQIAAGAITTAELSAGAVTTAKINAGAVTANELAANSVTTAKIAAGAVNAEQIAAGAVSTTKLLVAPGVGGYANPDPLVQDPSAWSFSFVIGANPNHYPYFNAGNGLVSTWDKTDGGLAQIEGPLFPVTAYKTYLIESSIYQWSAGTPLYYLFVAFYDVTGTLLTGSVYPTGWTSPGTYHYFGRIGETVPVGASRYSISFGANANAKIPTTAVRARVGIIGDYANLGGVRWSWGGAQVREIVPGELIVDGAITANKIAANAIAVGTAAIQNGAIVNAMIADATIDSAKIATLSAGKITAGSLGVGSFIQSNDYVSGVSGWRISGSGFAELDSVAIRGNFSASRISAGNIQSGGYIRSTTYTPGSTGWSINADGTAEFGAASIRGKLSAGNIVGSNSSSSFSGEAVSVASGILSAGQLLPSAPIEIDLQQPPSGGINFSARFQGFFTLTLSAFGANETSWLDFAVTLSVELWNGSNWGTSISGATHYHKLTHTIVASQAMFIPVALNASGIGVSTSFTKCRLRILVGAGRFTNLAYTTPLSRISAASFSGNFDFYQAPN